MRLIESRFVLERLAISSLNMGTVQFSNSTSMTPAHVPAILSFNVIEGNGNIALEKLVKGVEKIGIDSKGGYLDNGVDLGLRRTRRGVNEIVENSSLVLAEERTHRRDPLDGFRRYAGGWNISDTHYWTPYGYSRTCYALSLIFLIVFTIAAIGGCVVLYTGQGKFHTSTRDTLDFIVSQAHDTVDKLDDVSGYLSAAKNVGVDQVTLPQALQTRINDLQSKINASSSTLSRRTDDNARKIQTVLDDV
ncbi:hypothetical protein AKJ16_DCAP00251 [Drosera capensis]